jgi:heptosyltransferase III
MTAWRSLKRPYMPRILFITSNRIGDAVLSTGALDEALARHPGAAVVIACGPLPAPLFRATPRLDRIEIVRKREGRWSALWASLRREKFDLAIDLRGSLVTLGLNAKKRIIHRKTRMVRHKLEELAEMLRLETPPTPHLRIDAQAEADAAAVIGPAPRLLALGPGANFIGKRWPPASFAALSKQLPLDDLPVLLLGAPEDAAICGEIADLLGPRAINAAGKLDLLAAAAALRRAALFVGNDSGLMHIAAAVGAPTVGLFGPSDERVYGPWGPRTRAVRGPRSFEEVLSVGYMPLIEFTLMDDLPVEKVEAVARELLGAGT